MLQVLLAERNREYRAVKFHDTLDLLQQVVGYVAQSLKCNALIDAGVGAEGWLV
jgi:hypothetical protein